MFIEPSPVRALIWPAFRVSRSVTSGTTTIRYSAIGVMWAVWAESLAALPDTMAMLPAVA